MLEFFLKNWHKKITSPIFLENDVGASMKRKKTTQFMKSPLVGNSCFEGKIISDV